MIGMFVRDGGFGSCRCSTLFEEVQNGPLFVSTSAVVRCLVKIYEGLNLFLICTDVADFVCTR